MGLGALSALAGAGTVVAVAGTGTFSLLALIFLSDSRQDRWHPRTQAGAHENRLVCDIENVVGAVDWAPAQAVLDPEVVEDIAAAARLRLQRLENSVQGLPSERLRSSKLVRDALHQAAQKIAKVRHRLLKACAAHRAGIALCGPVPESAARSAQ